MEKKLNITEIVNPNDILQEQMKDIIGGANDFSICLKGCITGDKKEKENEQKESVKMSV